MTTHHRLDPSAPPHNDLTSGESGFVHDPRKVRTSQPDKSFPKMPETDYHHDQGTTPDTKSPGPFHGDDLVTQQNTAPDVHAGGRQVDSYMYPDGEHTEDARKLKHKFELENYVPVKVVDTVVKERRLIHQVMTSALIAPGQSSRLVGKDPTRVKIKLQTSGPGAILIQPDIGLQGIPIAGLGLYGFPIPSTANLELETEDELFAYAGTDVAVPGLYVSILVTMVRDTDSLEEFYDGGQ